METKIDPKNVPLMASRPSATNSIKRSVPTYSQAGDRPHKIFRPLTVQFGLRQKTTDVFLLKKTKQFSHHQISHQQRHDRASAGKTKNHLDKSNRAQKTKHDKRANCSQSTDRNQLRQLHPHSEQRRQCFRFASGCKDGRDINLKGEIQRIQRGPRSYL